MRLAALACTLLAACQGTIVGGTLTPAVGIDAGAALDGRAPVSDAGALDADPVGSQDATSTLDAAPDGGLGGDAEPGLDRSSLDATPIDANPTASDAGGIPMFIAQGHLARTTLSCDLGQSWVADRDDAAPLDRCWTTPPAGGTQIECDHQPTAGRGIAFGGGWFVANFGWGLAGGIRRTQNGVDWTVVKPGENYAGTVFISGRFLAGSESPDLSDDDGQSWQPAADPPNVWSTLGNVRRVGAGQLAGQDLVLLSADLGLAISTGGARPGAGWTLPPSPAACRAGQTEGGIAIGDGAIVLVNNGTTACASRDGGQSFQLHPLGGTADSHLLSVAQELWQWGHDDQGTPMLFKSRDGGQSWSATPTATRRAGGMGPGPGLGPVAFGAGVFVGVNGGWDQWYERQQFYRSTDGVTWDALPSSAFKGSHPIRFIGFGLGQPSAACP